MIYIRSDWIGELWTIRHVDHNTLVPARDEFFDSEHEPALLFASEADAKIAADYHRKEYGDECVPLKLRDALN